MGKLEELLAIYDSLPKMECKGLCVDDCSIVYASNAEKALIRNRTRRPVAFNSTDPKPRSCPYLDGHRCSIYEVRPLICRLYGLIDPKENAVLCRFGCKPDRYLSGREGQELLARARNLMGFTVGPTAQDAEVYWTEQGKWLEEHNAPHDPVRCQTCAALLRNRKKVKEILSALAMTGAADE